jgi:uncharacterized protein YndB with AHSA1/START domain
MPFALRAEDLSFPDRAQVRLAFSRVVPAPPERVFDVLADHEGWTRWFVDFKKASVTSAAREGLGTRRRVWVGPMVLDEQFIAWESGRRFSFTMLASNLPILSAMVEDWRLAPVESGTRVDYTVGFDLPGWIRPLKGVLLWKFRPLFEKALPNLEDRLREGIH